MVSNSYFLSENQSQRFLETPNLKTSGYADQFLLVDMRQHTINYEIRLPNGNPWEKFVDVVNNLVDFRNSHETVVYTLSPEASEIYQSYVRDRHAQALKLGLRRCPIFDRIGTVALKYALALHLCEVSGGVVEGEQMKCACAITDSVLSSHLNILEQFGSPSRIEEQLGNGFEIIVERLRVRGPLTRRDLARTFHRQKSARWEPLLARAVEVGAVTSTDDGRFALAEGEHAVVQDAN
jgi:hypothetical protein